MAKVKHQLLKDSWGIIRDSFTEFINDKVLKHSAALAYYTIFSLPAMLIVVIGLCSIFYGKEAIQGRIFSQISGFIGADAALQIQDILQKTTLHHDNFVATIIGAITLLIAATGMFGEIQDSINSIWGLQAKPEKGFIKMILNRVMSFSMIVVLGFILLLTLVVNALLEGLWSRLAHYFSEDMVNFLFLFDYGLMIVVTTVLFASILKVLPDAKILWKDVWVGAFVTSLLFLLGKYLIGYYLKHNTSISAYGAAGSMIIILLWVYYSAIILYFGAEFTQVYVRHKKRRIEPNRYAVWVEKNIVEKKLNTQINEHTTTIDKKTIPINDTKT
ncbi:MAG: YihY/virulence factor BrkB family protein [Bacteroidetes bacterium]|nr:YihY/virulence factor BrkB family protein [Bacteroidota bacterium]